MRCKAESVRESGESDGWLPTPSFTRDISHGSTQLVVSVPPTWLPSVHRALLDVLQGPLRVLWRQHVDRRNPQPQGAPPRDFVAIDLNPSHVHKALADAAPLLYGDARGELWVAGRMGDEVILDPDGLVCCRPDDPAFRDVLMGLAIVEDDEAKTIVDRDYVKHWFHADNDALEDGLIARLGLTDVG